MRLLTHCVSMTVVAAAIAATVLAYNLLADGLRARLSVDRGEDG